jgi:hypothetical protein
MLEDSLKLQNALSLLEMWNLDDEMSHNLGISFKGSNLFQIGFHLHHWKNNE